MIKNQNGFTLIEVLIAITLLSFVMLGIVTVSENSLETKDRVTEEDNKYLQVETAMDRIEWDISHLYTPLYFSIFIQANTEDEVSLEAYNSFMLTFQDNNRFNNASYESLQVPKNNFSNNRFVFFTLANRRKRANQRQSYFAWVKYELISPSANDEKSFTGTYYLTRQFLADNVFNKESIPWDKIRSQTLLKNVESIKFQFWDYKTKKWLDRLTSIKNGENIIHGVKVNIKIKETQDDIKVIERVYRPLFPKFQSEDYYGLKRVEDDKFLSNPTGEVMIDVE